MMDPSSYKTVVTSRSFSYSYYSSVATATKATIILLHGFPEYADMWADQVALLNGLGHGCIAPDLLGYGGTDKPTDTEAYNSEGLAQDIADILDAEGVSKAILVGHDWGSYLAGRFANWHPEKTIGLVLTSVAYRPAGKLDLAASNAALKKSFGYEPFGYWEWISSAEAPAFLEAHVESFFSLLFAADETIWKTDFTPTGQLVAWLSADKTVPSAPFATKEMKDTLLRRWNTDGFEPMLGWFRAMTTNTHWTHEQKLDASVFKLPFPVLFIGGARDAPAPAILGQLVTKPLCEDYTGTVVDSGHWMLRERPGEWMEVVKAWLAEKF